MQALGLAFKSVAHCAQALSMTSRGSGNAHHLQEQTEARAVSDDADDAGGTGGTGSFQGSVDRVRGRREVPGPPLLLHCCGQVRLSCSPQA